MDLSQVSRTAILTLICRAIEAQSSPSTFNDPMSVVCLDRLVAAASVEDRRWILAKKRMYTGYQRGDAKELVRRVRVFDNAAQRFIAAHPNCTVVELAGGFDTRYWRIGNEQIRYIEIDLPQVVNLKKELLQDHIRHEMIACSVLDTSWMDQVTRRGNEDFLLIAEGLFMWFPQPEVARIFKEISQRFCRSQLVLDVVPERYTRGIWKALLRMAMRLVWNLDTPWASGVKDPHELEAYGKDLKIIRQEKGSVGPVLTLTIGNAP